MRTPNCDDPMIRCRFNLPRSTLPLLFALALAAPAGASDADPLANAPKAPAEQSATEVVTGELHELVIDDRVANMTLRHRAVRLADGTTLRLQGDSVAGLAARSQVEVTGRRNGATLFADAAREIAPAPGRRSAASTSEVDGVLQMYYADYLEQGRHEIGFDVKRDDGTVVPLALPVRSEALHRGMRVRASGAALPDGGIEPETIVIEALPEGSEEPGAFATAVKTDKVLVILMRFTDSPAPTFTQAQVQQVVAGGSGSGSVAEYYKEVSYGQQLLNVTVTPWLSTGRATPSGCNYSLMGSYGRDAATAAGYAVSNYQKLVYVFPKVTGCGWLGLGYVGSSGAWINGANTVLVFGHELGHNFGMYHAGSLDCGGNVIGGSCTSAEYGDPFNIMGSSKPMHMGVPQKFALGWIAASAIKSHTTGATTYTLNPVETAGGTTYAVKVQASTYRTYWIEYRKPIGFDAGLASYPNNGVQIRLKAPFETLCSGCSAYSQDSQVLDATPATSTFTDLTLPVGSSFTDTKYGYTFNVLSATTSGLQLQVVSPGSSSSTTSLASALNPSTYGASTTFTATVTGNAPTGTVAFKANGTTVVGCGTVALAGSGSTRTAACATAALAAGTHSIVASYSGDSANPASSSPVLSQIVNTVTTTGGGNVALASNGATATASSVYSVTRSPAKVIDNERAGSGFASGNGAWLDATSAVWPDWAQVDFNGSKSINRVVVYSLQDNYASPVEPTDTLVGTKYVAQDFLVQGWSGSAWVTLATVSGNSLVKRTVTFNAYTTPRIRIHVTRSAGSYTGLTEIEAWATGSALATTTTLQRTSGSNPSASGASVGFSASVTGSSPTGTVKFTAGGTTITGCATSTLSGSGNTRVATCTTSALAAGTHSIVALYSGDATNAASTSSALSHTVSTTTDSNVALASSGASASASSTYSSGRSAARLIDNERAGSGFATGGGAWLDSTPDVWPDWAQIDFNGQKSINRVVVYSLQDNYTTPVEPTATLVGTKYVVRDFLVQAWNGSGWITLATVAGNTLVKRTVTFTAYTTPRIRIHVTNSAAPATYTGLTEVEAWGQ